MPGELKAAHEQLADQVAGMQGIRCRIEPDVQPHVALGQARGERVAIGGVVNEPTGVEFGKQIHTPTMLPAHRSETAHRFRGWRGYVVPNAARTN